MTKFSISPTTRNIAIGLFVAVVLVYALRPMFSALSYLLFLLIGLGFWVALIWFVVFLVKSNSAQNRARAIAGPTALSSNGSAPVTQEAPLFQGFVIGWATGRFRSRNAARSPEKGAVVSMDLPTACRGIITVGQQGSGKTTGVFNPLFVQASWLGWSTLTFAVKSNVPGSVYCLANEHRGNPNSCIALVAPPGHFDGIPDDFSRRKLNVLAGLSPESAAAAIGDALGEPKDPYWKQAPMRLAQSWLELLYALGDGSWIDLPKVEDKDGNILRVARRFRLEYSLNALRECIELSGKDLSIVLQVASEKEAELADATDEQSLRRREMLEDALRYFTVSYVTAFVQPSNGENLLASIRASLQAPLMALTGDRSIRETFCGETDIDLEDLLANGHHVIFAVDDSRFPNAVKMVNLFLFRRFADLTQRRLGKGKAITPCFVSMDEYGSFASRSHLNVLSRAREANFVPVVGVQSLSFLGDAMQSMDAARAVLGSLATVICCGASDPQTADWIRARCGQSTIRERVVSYNTGTSTNPGGNQSGHILSAFLPNETQTSGTSESEQSREKDLAGADTLATLGPVHNSDGTSAGLVRAVVIAAQQSGETRDVVRLHQITIDLN